MVRVKSWFFTLLAALFLLLTGEQLLRHFTSEEPGGNFDRGTLKVGYDSHFPYQFLAGEEFHRHVSGLDTELVREACRRAGYDLTFLPMTWDRAVVAIQRGELDAVSLAIKTPEREEFAYFSQPFLAKHTQLFYRRDRKKVAQLEDLAAIQQQAAQQKWVVGYSHGRAYPSEFTQILADARLKSNLLAGPDDLATLTALYEGRSDIAIMDALAGSALSLKNGWDREIVCFPQIVAPQDARLMFSKKSTSVAVVEAFNQAIESMRRDGTRDRLVRAYYLPTMVSLLAPAYKFEEISVLASCAAAVSGLFLACKIRANLLGTFLLAAAPALGGGFIRDLIAGRRPIGIVADPKVLLAIVFLVLLAFLFFRWLEVYRPKLSRRLDEMDVDKGALLVLLDGCGLGAFTLLGVLIALQTHCEPLWLWGPLLAATTNGGGSALRDILLGRPVGMLTSARPYLEVSVLWGWLFSLYLTFFSDNPFGALDQLRLAMGITIFGVTLCYFVLRRAQVTFPTLSTLTAEENRS